MQGVMMGAGKAEQACRQTQVDTAMNRMAELASQAAVLSNQLEARLQQVLRVEPPQPTKESLGIARAVSAPLAERVTAVCDGLQGSINQMNSILERLEV